jgi:hypothetical protein
MKHPYFDRYVEACNYPGVLDVGSVEAHLAEYLRALGVKRKIERIPRGWTLSDHPSLEKYTNDVLSRLPKGTFQITHQMDAASMRRVQD